MKIFLDTNVLVAALATRGLCSEIFEAVLQYHELVTCEQVLDELGRVFRAKLKIPGQHVNRYLDLIRAEATLAASRQSLSPAIKDRDDIPILEYAVGGGAHVFVTGDAELLALERIGELPIISPRQLWTRFAGLATGSS